MKKRVISIFILLITILSLCGCERTPNTVSFVNNSMKNTDRYIFTSKFDKESLYNNKYYDIQVLCDKNDVQFIIYEELSNDKFTIKIANRNEWYSLTTLILESQNLSNTETFTKYEEATSKTYIIESSNEFALNVRAVLGDLEKNSEETGFLLTNKLIISDVFKLDIKGKSTN